MSKKSGPLRLKALDKEGLKVISSLMQDATVLVGDMAYQKSGQHFALLANRFCWEDGKRAKTRVRTRLQFEYVQDAKMKNIPRDAAGHTMELLAITLGDDDNTVDLAFSGFATIRLSVEVLEAYMEDISEPWQASARPEHPDGESAA